MELTHNNIIAIHRWCVQRFGTSSPNHYNIPPRIIARPFYVKDGAVKSTTEGEYCQATNTITVFYATIKRLNPLTALYEAIKTIIHEYIHYLQDLTNYELFSQQYGYWYNPLEVQARDMANNYALRCYNEVFSCE